jgi:hypothetical protein
MSTGYEEPEEMVEPEPEEVHAEAVQREAPMPLQPMAEPPDYERTVRLTARPELEQSGPSAAEPEQEIAQDPLIEMASRSPITSTRSYTT